MVQYLAFYSIRIYNKCELISIKDYVEELKCNYGEEVFDEDEKIRIRLGHNGTTKIVCLEKLTLID